MNKPQIDPDSFVPIADQIELQQPPMNNQEWTSKDVWNLLDEGGGQMVADAHNAALAASNSQLDEAGSHNSVADRELRELRQQLAAEREKRKQSESRDDELIHRYKETVASLEQQLLQAHEVLKRIRMRHSNNDSTTREIDVALEKVKP